jgi:hypothetical protein
MKKPNIFQEADGSYSMRRLLAFLSWIAGTLSSFYAIPYASESWFVFIPSMAFLGFSALMLFFTTWADLKDLAKVLKGTP